MASKVFLDANFLLDLTLNRPGIKEASQVMRLGIDKIIQLFTTPAVLHVVSYFTSQALTRQQTKKVILLLLNDVQIIDCDHATALLAVNSSMDDVEDALQYYTALKFKLDYFISADKNLRKAAIPQVPVYTAAELLVAIEHN